MSAANLFTVSLFRGIWKITGNPNKEKPALDFDVDIFPGVGCMQTLAWFDIWRHLKRLAGFSLFGFLVVIEQENTLVFRAISWLTSRNLYFVRHISSSPTCPPLPP